MSTVSRRDRSVHDRRVRNPLIVSLLGAAFSLSGTQRHLVLQDRLLLVCLWGCQTDMVSLSWYIDQELI